MLTFDEARLLKMFKQLTRDDDRQDILDYLEAKLTRRAATVSSTADTDDEARALKLDDVSEGLQYFQKQYGGFCSERERKCVTLVAGKMSARQFVEAVDRTVLMCEHRGAVANYLYKVAQSMLHDDSE